MKHPPDRRAWSGYVISLVAAFAWAGTAPGISLLQSQGVPSLAIAFWRDLIIAVALFAGIGLIRPSALRVSRENFKGLVVAGLVSIGLYHALWVYSIKFNGAAVAVVLVYSYNAFVTLGARIIFKEAIRPMQIVALLVSFAGLFLVVRAYDPETWRVTWQGTLIGVASAIAQAVYVLFNQRFIKTISPLVSLGYLMGFGSVGLLMITLAISPPALTTALSGSTWAILVFLALGPTLGGYGLFNLALRYVPGKVAGLISVLEVPIAALISFALLGDTLQPPQLAGMALVLISTVLPNLRGFSAPEPGSG